MPVIKHIHKYVKFKSRPNYLRCEDTICTHYILKELAIGKISRCSFCNNEFQLTMEDLRRVRPLCLNCSNTKEARMRRKATALVNALAVDIPESESDILEAEHEWDDDKF